jgi:hypothetical protein
MTVFPWKSQHHQSGMPFAKIEIHNLSECQDLAQLNETINMTTRKFKNLFYWFCSFATLLAHGKSDEMNVTTAPRAEKNDNRFSQTQSTESGPGGVSNDLAFWLKANAGTSTTKNGAMVNAWLDQSGNGNKASKLAVAPVYRPNFINGNPVIDFSASGQAGMKMANSISVNSDSAYAEKSFLFCLRTGDNISARQVIYEQGGTTRGLNIYIEENRLYFGAWNKTGSPWGFFSINTPVNPKRVYIVSCIYQGNTEITGTLTCYLNGKLVGAISQLGILYSHPSNIGVGAMNNATHFHTGKATGNGFYFAGQLAELIGYNEALSNEESQRAESYLALKYGVTLDQSTAQNYIASDGSVIYPATTTHHVYDNNIAGIGRDDEAGLDQRKSRSINGNAILTIIHNEAFGADKSFLLWGHNGKAASLTADFDGGSNNRLARVWRVAETGAIGAVTVRIPVTVVTGLSHLLISSDKNFPPGATSKIMLNINNGYYEAVVDLNHGQYLTFASECPQLRAYTLVYQLDIPATPTNFNHAPVPYSIDNRPAITFPFDRIAYKLELVDGSGRQFICVSIEAFTNDVNKIGVPNVSAGAFFQQRVTNLEVTSNVPGIINGASISTGHIEFWPNNYAPGNSALVPNASQGLYDCGDDPASPIDGYGSMQIHNYDLDGDGAGAQGQTLLAYNAWGDVDDITDLGIGNAPSGHPDWTFAHNAANYSLRRLQVFVRPATVMLTKAPQPFHFFPRDRATNKARIPISGQVIRPGINEILVNVYRDDVLIATVTQPATYQSAFTIEAEITAELANYDLELLARAGDAFESIRRFEDIVTGDVYLIQGQSNAVALAFNGSVNANQSPFIRSFGTSDTSGAAVLADLSWHIAEGDGHYHAGGIGQWGLRMSRLLMDTYQIPIAVLNGGHLGKGINWFQRHDSAPDNVNTNYGRLLFRAKTAEVANAVRAIFWFQGESDGNAAQAHENGFLALYHDWKTDYPNLEKFYVNQVRAGCGNPSLDLRDRQRRFADSHTDIEVMSTNGLDGHDGCHFAYTEGYEKLGENLFRLAARDLYGAASTPNLMPPNIERAYFSNENKSEITLVMRHPDDVLTWDAGAENDFKIEGSAVTVTSGAIIDNQIVLTLSNNAATATGISYLGHSGPGPWVTNANGIGLLAFYNVPIVIPTNSAPGGVADGLKIWLKADAGVVQETGKVNAWIDQSGYGYIFTAIGADTARPDFQADFLNHQPAISIGANQHGLAAPSHFNHAVSDYTFIAVFQQTGGDYFVDNLNAVRFKLNNSALGLYRQNDYRLIGFNTANYVLQTWRFKDGDYPETAVFRQGELVASDNAYTPMPLADNFRIGSRYTLEDFSNFEGKVAEFIIYSRPLSDAERQQVESYLAGKYGFTLNQNAAQKNAEKRTGRVAELPAAFGLSQNYPNPFNMQTRIEYAIPAVVHVQLSLFNAAGQLVRHLVDAPQSPGYKSIHWDGKDNRGLEVGSGIYILRMQTGAYQQVRKIILQK